MDDTIKPVGLHFDNSPPFGYVHPIVGADFQGKKWVAVADKLYRSKNWKTFPDFLMDFITLVLGSDWGKTELKKMPEKRHPIIQWYVKTCQLQQRMSGQKNANGIYQFRPNGASAAYINLAYDLYVLKHHTSLLESVVNRLKHADQFQGARYELLVAASCIRAGFDLTHEDETDGNKRHPEFLATHRMTGQRIWIEAKSRHRPGVLGRSGPFDPTVVRAGVNGLLRDAADKAPNGSYAVFVDVNLPVSSENIFTNAWCTECMETFCNLEDASRNFVEPFNLAVFTSFPHHYGSDDEDNPRGGYIAIYAKQPRYPAPLQPFLDLASGTEKYGHVQPPILTPLPSIDFRHINISHSDIRSLFARDFPGRSLRHPPLGAGEGIFESVTTQPAPNGGCRRANSSGV